jgi:hypothetical protein
MSAPALDVVLKRFEAPDEVRSFPKGRLELVTVGGATIGRATYEPGWRWSEHVGPTVGESRCHIEHAGLVLTGTATAAFDDGRVVMLRAGELFHIPAVPHDSWVVGDEEYSSLHFLGASDYASAAEQRPARAAASKIADELERVMAGDAWFGDPVATILTGVSPAQARQRPLAGAHSIWEVVRHMTAWTEEVTQRLGGAPAGTPAIGDWPGPSGPDDEAWRRDVERLFEAHRTLMTAVSRLKPGALAAPTNDPRNRELGTGVSREVMLHGLAQHHAYHAGQIALLKRA